MEYAKPFFHLMKEINIQGGVTVRNTCLPILCTRKVSRIEELTQFAVIETEYLLSVQEYSRHLFYFQKLN